MVDEIGKIGTPKGRPPIDAQIMAELQKYGLQPQGSRAADEAAITTAKSKQGSAKTDNQGNIFDPNSNKGKKPVVNNIFANAFNGDSSTKETDL